MLATDTGAEIWTSLTAILHCHLDELAYTLLVKHLEWIYLKNLLFHVCWEEGSDVVTRVTEGHLCEVVGTE